MGRSEEIRSIATDLKSVANSMGLSGAAWKIEVASSQESAVRRKQLDTNIIDAGKLLRAAYQLDALRGIYQLNTIIADSLKKEKDRNREPPKGGRQRKRLEDYLSRNIARMAVQYVHNVILRSIPHYSHEPTQQAEYYSTAFAKISEVLNNEAEQVHAADNPPAP